MRHELEKNAAGRLVPTEVNGRESMPYQGVGAHRPSGRKAAPRIATCADYPADGDKRASSLARPSSGSGWPTAWWSRPTTTFETATRWPTWSLTPPPSSGLRDLMWFPSASFPVHANQIDTSTPASSTTSKDR